MFPLAQRRFPGCEGTAEGIQGKEAGGRRADRPSLKLRTTGDGALSYLLWGRIANPRSLEAALNFQGRAQRVTTGFMPFVFRLLIYSLANGGPLGNLMRNSF